MKLAQQSSGRKAVAKARTKTAPSAREDKKQDNAARAVSAQHQEMQKTLQNLKQKLIIWKQRSILDRELEKEHLKNSCHTKTAVQELEDLEFDMMDI